MTCFCFCLDLSGVLIPYLKYLPDFVRYLIGGSLKELRLLTNLIFSDDTVTDLPSLFEIVGLGCFAEWIRPATLTHNPLTHQLTKLLHQFFTFSQNIGKRGGGFVWGGSFLQAMELSQILRSWMESSDMGQRQYHGSWSKSQRLTLIEILQNTFYDDIRIQQNCICSVPKLCKLNNELVSNRRAKKKSLGPLGNTLDWIKVK